MPGAPPSKPSVAYELASISERIEDVMKAFDLLCAAAGRPPRFELALRLLEAHRIVQWEVEQRLAGLPWRLTGKHDRRDNGHDESCKE